MILDFIVGICASIVASLICGFFSKKAFGKSTDILTTFYSIYIGFSVFVFSALLVFLLSENIQSVIISWSGENVFSLIRYATSLFWILFVNVTIVTIIFIIVRQIELSTKSMDKIHKNTLNHLEAQKKESDDK